MAAVLSLIVIVFIIIFSGATMGTLVCIYMDKKMKHEKRKKSISSETQGDSEKQNPIRYSGRGKDS